jgi:DNA end-binding protein Ku
MGSSRATWSGSITFGMVVVPVKLHVAVEGKDAVSFNQVRRSDGSQIRYKRVAEADGEEVAYADIAKAYQYGDQKVIFDDADMASLPLSSSKRIDVEHFASLGEIDPMLLGKSYYVVPGSDAAAHAYTLLAYEMWAGRKVAIAKVALRQRENVAMLHAELTGGPGTGQSARVYLVLTLLSWPDEVRSVPSFLTPEVKPAEAKMARELIDAMTAEFNPSAYTDNYRAAVEAKAAEKTAGDAAAKAVEGTAKAAAGATLMDSLTAAVQAAKAAK